MMKHSRRSFLTKTALAATALSTSKVMGANDKIRMGFIGLGGRGASSAKWFDEIDGVEVAYMCDCDLERAEGNAKRFDGAKATNDLRKVIEDPTIDAVCISTCNHWHVLASIWAIEAGKDVYVEKPISHNVWEGRQLVACARKHNAIVQGGTQQRSDPFQLELREELASGDTIGKIEYARCNRYGKRNSIGKRDTPLAPPSNIDYDLWLGPAADVEIFREKFHYDWHWDFNCGNGELGNWGPHILDDVRNVVFGDRVTLPTKVMAGGGRVGYHDAGESPNTHFVYFDTPECPVIMDVHGLPYEKDTNRADVYIHEGKGINGFLVVHCEGGYYAGGRGGGALYNLDNKKIKTFKGSGGKDHAQNFIDAVRSRKQDDLNAEIEEIHYSSAWCHLGNIGWQLGSEYSRDVADAQLDFEPWNEVIASTHKHLEANEVNLKEYDFRIGPMLDIDPSNETFVGENATPEAKALLTREYRKGYEVPDFG